MVGSKTRFTVNCRLLVISTLLNIAFPGIGRTAECPSNPAGMRASIVQETDQECAIEHNKTFRAFRVLDGRRQQDSTATFHRGDRVVLCVNLPFSGYVTVWDAAPNGQRERLYPNAISHPSGETSVHLVAEQDECIGEIGSGYEIEVTPQEGAGGGQFYLLVTDQQEMQLSAADFVVPAYGLSVSVTPEKKRIEDIRGYYDAWIRYEVLE